MGRFLNMFYDVSCAAINTPENLLCQKQRIIYLKTQQYAYSRDLKVKHISIAVEFHTV